VDESKKKRFDEGNWRLHVHGRHILKLRPGVAGTPDPEIKPEDLKPFLVASARESVVFGGCSSHTSSSSQGEPEDA
jgi:hypothetical protein